MLDLKDVSKKLNIAIVATFTILFRFELKELIQYQGEAEEVSGNTVGCSLELPGLCPGQYLPPGRSP